MASMLNPPMSEEDLVGAMTGHSQPEVQNGMVCGYLKTAQDSLAFLGEDARVRKLKGRSMEDHAANMTTTMPIPNRGGGVVSGRSLRVH